MAKINQFERASHLKESDLAITATVSLEVNQQHLEVSTAGVTVITLPNVGIAAGRFYHFYMVADGGNATIQDNDESLNWTDKVMTAVADFTFIYSTGKRWVTINETLT